MVSYFNLFIIPQTVSKVNDSRRGIAKLLGLQFQQQLPQGLPVAAFVLKVTAERRGAARQFDSHYAPWGTGGLSPEDENYGGIAIDLAALRAWTVAE